MTGSTQEASKISGENRWARQWGRNGPMQENGLGESEVKSLSRIDSKGKQEEV